MEDTEEVLVSVCVPLCEAVDVEDNEEVPVSEEVDVLVMLCVPV